MPGLSGPSRLDPGDFSSMWAFPLRSPPTYEPIFLMVVGSEPLSDEEIFLLSVLAQMCGTVIAKLELIAAERATTERGASLNTELGSPVSTLTKIFETHPPLNEIVPDAAEIGTAETRHQLT